MSGMLLTFYPKWGVKAQRIRGVKQKRNGGVKGERNMQLYPSTFFQNSENTFDSLDLAVESFRCNALEYCHALFKTLE